MAPACSPASRGLGEGLAEGEGAVLGAVVIVHREVSAADQLQAPERVEGEAPDEVIQEADARIDADLASVQIEGEDYLGLAGLPGYRREARGRVRGALRA